MANPTVTMTGKLAADPEFKSLPTGSLLKFRVITNDRTQNANGEWVDKDTSGWNVEAWSNVADNAKDVLKKGMGVTIIGVQRQRSYETTAGEKRSVTEIKANSISVDVYSASKIKPSNTVRDVSQDEDIWAVTTPKQMVEAPF